MILHIFHKSIFYIAAKDSNLFRDEPSKTQTTAAGFSHTEIKLERFRGNGHFEFVRLH